MCIFTENSNIRNTDNLLFVLFHKFMHWGRFILPKGTLAPQKIILAEVLLVCQIVF